VALLARWAIDPIFGDHLAFVTLYVAIAVTSWYGGLRPTLFVVVAGGLAAAYWFIPPRFSLAIALPLHRFQATYFVVSGVVMGCFGEAMHLARRRADRQMEETRRKQEELSAEIAARRRLEDELQRRNEQLLVRDRNKDHFLAVLGHELRNPLAAIRTTLEAMVENDNIEPKLKRHFEVIERQSRSLHRLVDDLLDVARITRGTIELRLEAIDVSVVLGHATETVRPLANARSHTLTIEMCPTPLWVRADSTRLEQIMVNLIQNAIKYTDPNGQIQVSCKSDGSHAVLGVSDTGRGIAAEDLPRVFDSFLQLDSSPARKQEGLGLGLSVAKRLAEMHGGAIAASSAGLDKGSEFVVRLPLLPAAPEPKPAPRPSTATPVDGLQKVLLVDDNEDLCRSMGELLEHLGYEVRLTSDGPKALAEAERFSPDAILMDIGLPGMDGYEVARRLRRDPRFANTLLIAITGFGLDDEEQQAQRAGFDRQLVKPVRAVDLQEALTASKVQGS
jgi:two-component system CheB/CheR fusion protein